MTFRLHRGDLAAGLTVTTMLVPQAMAYAQLADLPPQVGLAAATLPLVAYAAIGTSNQLAVGPVAIVSLMAAGATHGDPATAAALALLVGIIHMAVGAARFGFLVNVLSHSVLVGFTAASGIIIGVSELKHLLGVPIERSPSAFVTFARAFEHTPDWPTVAVGAASIAALMALRRVPKLPGALIVTVAATVFVSLTHIDVDVVGKVPSGLPRPALPALDGATSLLGTAAMITLVSFVESIAVARVYARKHHDELAPNRELVALGAANAAAGLVGGFPVTGGISRTAVNDSAGATTRFAAVITAIGVALTLVAFTPLLTNLPQATLGAIIVVALSGLIDLDEMRHIATVKRTDLVGLGTAFFATLLLGIEKGLLLAIAASIIVVLVRMATPHTAVLGRLPGTSLYRNVDRFPDVERPVRIIRIDASLSFLNASFAKRRLLAEADGVGRGAALVLDAAGINDLDASGVDMLNEVFDELDNRGVSLHLAETKGPVRDVMIASGLWQRLGPRTHVGVDEAVRSVLGEECDRTGVDERDDTNSWNPNTPGGIIDP